MQAPGRCRDSPREAIPGDDAPHQQHRQVGGHHQRRAQVLGLAGQRVVLAAGAVHYRLDGGIGQLHHDHQDTAEQQQHALDASLAKPEGRRKQEQAENDLGAEGFLVAPGRLIAENRKLCGQRQALEAAVAGFGHGDRVVFVFCHGGAALWSKIGSLPIGDVLQSPANLRSAQTN